MHKMILAVALTFAIGTTAHAQSWMYQTGPGGTPPFAYGGPAGPFGGNPYQQYQTAPQPQYTPPPPNLAPPRIPMLDNPPSRSRCPYGVQC
jgi:hypothetical protein